ncbi:MAG: endonuclease domain-containing protein [Anaerolineaceae bacterium]
MRSFNQIKNHSLLHQISKDFRKEPTTAENKLWNFLSKRKFNGYKFRRQHPIGPFIVDFCCVQLKLIIEIDGKVHDFQKEYDQEREVYLIDEGYQVIRFSNNQVLEDIPSVLNVIKNRLQNEL